FKEVTQASRQNLLIFGRYDDNIARSSWSDVSNPSYAIPRREGEQLGTLQGPAIAIIHSHLGNGKTLIFRYAQHLLATSRKQSFTIRGDVSPGGLKQALSAIPTGSHVFFEGDVFAIADSADVIRERSLILCASSRTTTIRVAMPALVRAARGMIKLFDSNQLSETELISFH